MTSRVRRPVRERIEDGLAIGLLLLAVAIILFPILWLVLTSIKPNRDIFGPPFAGFVPTLGNYRHSFQQNQVGLYLVNSLTIGLAATALSVVLGSLAAYGFLRFRVPLGPVLFFVVLAARMAPSIALVVPVFLLLRDLGLLNSHAGLILVYTAINIPLAVWIMYGFFAELPWELEDAARIDGASRVGVFFRIILPMSQSGLAAVAVFTFIACWNEFLLALVLTSSQRARTMPVALALLNTEYGVRWDYLSAAGVTLMVPVIFFTFLMQKYIVQGLTFGAVKG